MQTYLNINITVDELREIIATEVKDTITLFLPMLTSQIEPQDDLLKVDEVAKIFKVSTVTIFDWKKKGKLPFHRISRKIFFKRSEVMKALEKINSGAINHHG